MLTLEISTALISMSAYAANGTFGKNFVGWITLNPGQTQDHTITINLPAAGYVTLHTDCYAAILDMAQSRYEIYVDGVMALPIIGYEHSSGNTTAYQRFHTQGLYQVSSGRRPFTFRVYNYGSAGQIQLNRCPLIGQFESVGKILTFENVGIPEESEAEKAP